MLLRMVRWLPRGFREQFEFEMIEYIEREYEAARSRGRLAAIGYAPRPTSRATPLRSAGDPPGHAHPLRPTRRRT
jgi:hypothetical protein